MDLLPIIDALRQKRSIFYSEADFKFALAGQIQKEYPAADIRLEYPPKNSPNQYIDILVGYNGFVYPIELKYKTKKISVSVENELFRLKDQGAQDLGVYDCMKDICRIESFAGNLDSFQHGYILWLTNDPYYWTAPRNTNAGYVDFSIHQGAVKSGIMKWGNHLSAGTTKDREKELVLKGKYEIEWKNYSDLNVKHGIFKYAQIQVNK